MASGLDTQHDRHAPLAALGGASSPDGHSVNALPGIPRPETAPARPESVARSPMSRAAGAVGELILFPGRVHPDAPTEPLADAPYEGTDELERILDESRRYRRAVMRRERRRRATLGRVPGQTTG